MLLLRLVSMMPLCLLLGATVPLSPRQTQIVQTAIDGADHHEEAFLALVENVQSWTEGPGDEPVRLQPNYAAMLAEPSHYRGDLCRVSGVLQQRTALPPPSEMIEEWLVRDASGRPVAVYVVSHAEPMDFSDGEHVELLARFYKRIDAIARDGTLRSYAAFVGAFPKRMSLPATHAAQPQNSQPDALLRLGMIAGALAAMVIAFAALMIWIRRTSAASPRLSRVRPASVWESDHVAPDDADESSQPPLPEDPAEALAELKRRAVADSE